MVMIVEPSFGIKAPRAGNVKYFQFQTAWGKSLVLGGGGGTLRPESSNFIFETLCKCLNISRCSKCSLALCLM